MISFLTEIEELMQMLTFLDAHESRKRWRVTRTGPLSMDFQLSPAPREKEASA